MRKKPYPSRFIRSREQITLLQRRFNAGPAPTTRYQSLMASTLLGDDLFPEVKMSRPPLIPKTTPKKILDMPRIRDNPRYQLTDLYGPFIIACLSKELYLAENNKGPVKAPFITSDTDFVATSFSHQGGQAVFTTKRSASIALFDINTRKIQSRGESKAEGSTLYSPVPRHRASGYVGYTNLNAIFCFDPRMKSITTFPIPGRYKISTFSTSAFSSHVVALTRQKKVSVMDLRHPKRFVFQYESPDNKPTTGVCWLGQSQRFCITTSNTVYIYDASRRETLLSQTVVDPIKLLRKDPSKKNSVVTLADSAQGSKITFWNLRHPQNPAHTAVPHNSGYVWTDATDIRFSNDSKKPMMMLISTIGQHLSVFEMPQTEEQLRKKQQSAKKHHIPFSDRIGQTIR